MWRVTFTVLLLVTSIAAAAAQNSVPSAIPPIDSIVVYIECKSPDGKTSRGSGVLVSGDGAVLTAKHVVPVGFTCMGGIGTAAATPVRKLIRDTRQVSVDAMQLKFVRTAGEVFPFIRYQRIQDSLRGKPISAYGFPGAGVGDIFETNGTIAQTNIDERGIFGTNALQSSGMSGGPVLLKEDNNLVGIIVGADFDPSTGAPSSFAVLAAQDVAGIFELTAAPTTPQPIVPPELIAPNNSGQTPNINRAVTPPYVPQYEGLLREALIAVAQGICPDSMSALLHTTCNQQMPTFQRVIKQKGNLISTQFSGIQPTPMGPAETYSVSFSQGPMVWMINTTPDGKILTFWSPSQ